MKQTPDYTPEQLAELYRQIFEVDKRGQILLEDLVTRFSKPAVTTGGIDAILKTFTNQGENNVVQFIVRQINRANNIGAEENEPET